MYPAKAMGPPNPIVPSFRKYKTNRISDGVV
jgi:hypothetical protein